MENELIYNDIRIGFLGADILRIERKYQGEFCDGETFFIPDRRQFSADGPAYALKENVLRFGDFALHLPQGGTFDGLRLEKNGEKSGAETGKWLNRAAGSFGKERPRK